MKTYFYQINKKTWKVMDRKFSDVGRIREMGDGRFYVRVGGNVQVVSARLSDIQQHLI